MLLGENICCAYRHEQDIVCLTYRAKVKAIYILRDIERQKALSANNRRNLDLKVKSML